MKYKLIIFDIDGTVTRHISNWRFIRAMRAAKALTSGLMIAASIVMLSARCVFAESAEYQAMRKKMVESQITARGVRSRPVIDAMLKVPRHEFVPEKYRQYSYADGPLPIGYKQTISQPYIVALMTELADIQSSDRVLEIGTGSGYQAAILGELAKEVYTIEILEPLAERSADKLSNAGYNNIHVRCGDGYKGWPEEAPFDAIIVTAAPEAVPQELLRELAPEGRLVVPVGKHYQQLKLLKNTGSGVVEKTIIPVRFVPMVRAKE
ncbi:protein-L-isoaspartate(D-aspartate) O-methyltransferase [Candidatus Omnitrophota bacterium]